MQCDILEKLCGDRDMQKSTLGIGGQLLDKSGCVHGSAHFECGAKSGDLATISTEFRAQSEQSHCTLTKGKSGAVSVEAELKGRCAILSWRLDEDTEHSNVGIVRGT